MLASKEKVEEIHMYSYTTFLSYYEDVTSAIMNDSDYIESSEYFKHIETFLSSWCSYSVNLSPDAIHAVYSQGKYLNTKEFLALTIADYDKAISELGD